MLLWEGPSPVPPAAASPELITHGRGGNTNFEDFRCLNHQGRSSVSLSESKLAFRCSELTLMIVSFSPNLVHHGFSAAMTFPAPNAISRTVFLGTYRSKSVHVLMYTLSTKSARDSMTFATSGSCRSHIIALRIWTSMFCRYSRQVFLNHLAGYPTFFSAGFV